MQIDFRKKLLGWNRRLNKRSMPWKGETNPYRVWVSEIILQQTRVEQGTAYYERFIMCFPTITKLAKSNEKEIFKNWEGLGYYNRCRNLIATAKIVSAQYKGQFPSSYDEILALPGIGPYTAAAIASFAFGLPYAVVDGNVERILARYFGITAAVGSAAGKKVYVSLAGALLDRKNPGIYNQAMMDFGATICKPQNPLCNECVQSENCQAFQQGWINELPVKQSPVLRKKRVLYYFIVSAGKNKVWIRKRIGNDIWQNLYEFVLWETGKIIPQAQIMKSTFFKKHFGKEGFHIQTVSNSFNQILTHQSITCQFLHITESVPKLEGYESVYRQRLSEFPFPKLMAEYLKTCLHPNDGKDFDGVHRL
jgi:A/G-specific adenine glycosylase